MKKRITLICSYCALTYAVPNAKGKLMRDWNIDSAVCTQCGMPRNISLPIWGEIRACRICRKQKPLFSFHNGAGMICEACHDLRGKNKKILYNGSDAIQAIDKPRTKDTIFPEVSHKI